VLRLYSAKLEATTLKSITSSADSIAGWIFPRVAKDSFGLKSSQEVFRRIQTLTSKNGTIPYWEDLMEDLAISEETREILSDVSSGVIESKREAHMIVKRLDSYRKARTFFSLQKIISTKLKADSVDLDAMEEDVADYLTRLRHRSSLEDFTTSFGGKNFDKKSLLAVLNQSKNEFIPTGFRAFDSVNQGVPRESAFILAGTTGSGKSMLAINLAINQARIGAKISLTSLEMSLLENNRRILSCLTAIPLSQINRAHEMDRATKKMLIDGWKNFHNQVKNNGGRFDVISPDEDVTIEEQFTRLRSRGYDNNIVDYMGLLKGMDGDDQWRALGSAARYAKIYTRADKSTATLLAQLSEEGKIRYSKMVQEHASLMWTWQTPDESGIITVKQPKARNLRAFDFPLQMDYSTMRVNDVDVSQLVQEKSKPKLNRYREKPKQVATRRSSNESKEEYQL